MLIKEGSVVSTGSASKVITGENIRNVFDIEVDIIMPHRLVIPANQGQGTVLCPFWGNQGNGSCGFLNVPPVAPFATFPCIPAKGIAAYL